jgi:hypothetical protein
MHKNLKYHTLTQLNQDCSYPYIFNQPYIGIKDYLDVVRICLYSPTSIAGSIVY